MRKYSSFYEVVIAMVPKLVKHKRTGRTLCVAFLYCWARNSISGCFLLPMRSVLGKRKNCESSVPLRVDCIGTEVFALDTSITCYSVRLFSTACSWAPCLGEDTFVNGISACDSAFLRAQYFTPLNGYKGL
jgi:hypothetical protein